MATDSSNANEGVSAGGDGTIHLILQGKGGVGKSVIASWLAEFLISRGRQVRCVDGDPVNRSLSQYKALGAENLDLVNEDGLIQRWRYVSLVERFLTSADVFVVDSGATAFLPFWTYIVESEMIRVLREARRKVYLHVPVTGGETLNDTLLGFSAMASATTDRSVIVWLNEYFGPVTHGGKGFEEMQAYSDNRDKILTSVALPQRSPDTYGRTIRAMREKKLTLEEAINSPEFMLAQRSRLHLVRRDLFEQLERTPFVGTH
jgi:adenylylsulfate kinase-like enzyme